MKSLEAGVAAVEKMRRVLNQTSSEVPSELDSLFRAQIDQVSDQQYNVSLALIALVDSSDVPTAEASVRGAVAEAQRTALRACREYADVEAQFASKTESDVLRIPTDTGDLNREKQTIDRRLIEAVALHEKNDVEALDLLVSVAADYKEWRSKASATIAGTRELVASDRRKVQLQKTAITIAIVLGVVNLIVNIIMSIFKK